MDMTMKDKVIAFQQGISPDSVDCEVASAQLMEAEGLILNRMYPFGYPNGTTIPSRYNQLQIKLAIELFTMRGAEGQESHSENGTARTWPAINRTLRSIMPHVGSVEKNA